MFKEEKMDHSTQRAALVGGLFLMGGVICALVWSYYGALNGPFLFDDYGNLEKLALLNGSITRDSLSTYLNAGIAGPVGRPVALLTFLLNALDWPAAPWSFKYTNVLIHALNSLLVFWLTLLITRRTRGTSSAVTLIATLLAIVWAFSPFHVATVLYVVQRMALLASFFVLFGLVLYIKGRAMLEQQNRLPGLFLVLLAYVVGAGLGVLSKENAALFVLMVPLLEWIFFSRSSIGVRDQRTLWVIVGVPALLFLVALVFQWQSFSDEYRWVRDFSLSERLMTQARALGYYLWRYLIPGTEYFGVYGDGFEKSTGFLRPASTLIWMTIHSTLLILAVKVRKRYPLPSFGILFFYLAHSMESSFVPLELLFEHRSYLPSAFLLLPLFAIRSHKIVTLILAVAVLLNVSFLQSETHRWSSSQRFYSSSMERFPESERAAVALAGFYAGGGRFSEAAEVLRTFRRREPIGISAGLALIMASCQTGEVKREDIEAFVSSPRKYHGLPSFISPVGFLANSIRKGGCSGLSWNDLRRFLDVYISAFERGAQAVHAYHRALAEIDFMAGGIEAAEEHGLEALAAYPDITFAAQFCGALIRSGSGAACHCLDLAAEGFERGYKKTVTRMLLGYIQPRHSSYIALKEKICPGDRSRDRM